MKKTIMEALDLRSQQIMWLFKEYQNRFIDNIIENERQREVLKDYLAGYSAEIIAKRHGVSKQTIYDDQRKALNSILFRFRQVEQYLEAMASASRNISPKTALNRMIELETELAAAKIAAQDYFDENAFLRKYVTKEILAKIPRNEKEGEYERFDIKLTTLDFSVRAIHAFEAAGIKTLAELATWTRRNFLKQRNISSKTADEVEEGFEEHGLAWGMKKIDALKALSLSQK